MKFVNKYGKLYDSRAEAFFSEVKSEIMYRRLLLHKDRIYRRIMLDNDISENLNSDKDD